MRFLIAFCVLFAWMPQAFAVKNIMSLCDRRLSVDKDTEIRLAANQIAIEGQLGTYWQTGMGEKTAFQIKDDFLQRNITPLPMLTRRDLRPGDQLYLIDENGTVALSGFYGEVEMVVNVVVIDQLVDLHPNVPMLFADKELTEPIPGASDLRPLFLQSARAVVVQTLTEQEIKEAKERLAPWFERYEINKTQADRFYKIGRRRMHELSNFQIPHTGTFTYGTFKRKGPHYDVVNDTFNQNTEFTLLKIGLTDHNEIVTSDLGDFLYLLDGQGLVTAEGYLGSPEMPLASADPKALEPFLAKLKVAKQAVLIKTGMRQLPPSVLLLEKK